MGQLNGVVRRIHQLVDRREFGPQSDGQLLQRFIQHRDEIAFEGLLERHGPMVLGVCRRVLQGTAPGAADADDAFQATFLLLVKKADGVRPRDMVGNWLYGVAHRVALRARMMAAKRQVKEHEATTMTRRTGPDTTSPTDVWPEVQAVLDDELTRLPDKYRAPVVLCDLEGKPRKEAAAQLKVPEGTLSSRLNTGRRLLAKRLTRRGITLSAGALATLITEHTARAALPTALASSTMQAVHLAAFESLAAVGAVSANAALLTEGVLQSMFLTKLKAAAALLLAAAFLAGGFGLFAGLQAGAQQPAPETKNEQPLKPATAPETPPGQGKSGKKATVAKPAQDAYPLDDLKSRLKKYDDEVAKIREAMLKEIDDEEKKIKDLQKTEQEEAKKAGKPYFGSKLTMKLMELGHMRFSITTRYRVPVDEKKALAASEQRLGLHVNQIGGTLRAQLGLAKDEGLVVTRVDADSAAAKAGLKESDVMLQVQSKKVPGDVVAFRKMLKEMNVASVNVTILRQGKQQTIANLQLGPAEKGGPEK